MPSTLVHCRPTRRRTLHKWSATTPFALLRSRLSFDVPVLPWPSHTLFWGWIRTIIERAQEALEDNNGSSNTAHAKSCWGCENAYGERKRDRSQVTLKGTAWHRLPWDILHTVRWPISQRKRIVERKRWKLNFLIENALTWTLNNIKWLSTQHQQDAWFVKYVFAFLLGLVCGSRTPHLVFDSNFV